ncbi:hypothetical protein BU15DRAFT_67104 [Melanogaster broomeanus]|nr:hypothetical protein BU15DRAFT_67104 [Melanogaster broomeanus]
MNNSSYSRVPAFKTTFLIGQDPSREDPSFFDNLLDGLASIITSVFNFFGAPEPLMNTSPSSQSHRHSNVPGAYVRSESSLSRDHRGDHCQQRGWSVSSHYSVDMFSTLSSLKGSSEAHTGHHLILLVHSPISEIQSNVPLLLSSSKMRMPTLPTDLLLVTLVLPMYVDGSFTPSPALNQIVGDMVLGKAEELAVDQTVWMTAVAVAYLKKHLEGEPDLLDALLAKAQQFVEALGRSGGAREFEELVRKALGLLSLQTP